MGQFRCATCNSFMEELQLIQGCIKCSVRFQKPQEASFYSPNTQLKARNYKTTLVCNPPKPTKYIKKPFLTEFRVKKNMLPKELPGFAKSLEESSLTYQALEKELIENNSVCKNYIGDECGECGFFHPILDMPMDNVRECDIDISEKNYEVVILDKSAWTRDLSVCYSGIVCFTDGSQHNGHAATGVLIEKRGLRGKKLVISKQTVYLGNYASVYQSEVYGILQAAFWLKDYDCEENPVTIFCDNQNVLRDLKSNEATTSGLVVDCHRALNILAQGGNRIQLVWIPAHSGCEGNEKADRLARETVNAWKKQEGPIPFIAVAEETVIAEIENWSKQAPGKAANRSSRCTVVTSEESCADWFYSNPRFKREFLRWKCKSNK